MLESNGFVQPGVTFPQLSSISITNRYIRIPQDLINDLLRACSASSLVKFDIPFCLDSFNGTGRELLTIIRLVLVVRKGKRFITLFNINTCYSFKSMG